MPKTGKDLKPWEATQKRGKKNGRTEASEKGKKQYNFEIYLF